MKMETHHEGEVGASQSSSCGSTSSGDSKSSPITSAKKPIQLGVVQTSVGNRSFTGNLSKKSRWDQAPGNGEEEQSKTDESQIEVKSTGIKSLIQKFEDITCTVSTPSYIKPVEEVCQVKPVCSQTLSRIKLVRTNFMKPDKPEPVSSTADSVCISTSVQNEKIDDHSVLNVDIVQNQDITPVSASKALQIISSTYDSPTDDSSQEGNNSSTKCDKTVAESAHTPLENNADGDITENVHVIKTALKPDTSFTESKFDADVFIKVGNEVCDPGVAKQEVNEEVTKQKQEKEKNLISINDTHPQQAEKILAKQIPIKEIVLESEEKFNVILATNDPNLIKLQMENISSQSGKSTSTPESSVQQTSQLESFDLMKGKTEDASPIILEKTMQVENIPKNLKDIVQDLEDESQQEIVSECSEVQQNMQERDAKVINPNYVERQEIIDSKSTCKITGKETEMSEQSFERKEGILNTESITIVKDILDNNEAKRVSGSKLECTEKDTNDKIENNETLRPETQTGDNKKSIKIKSTDLIKNDKIVDLPKNNEILELKNQASCIDDSNDNAQVSVSSDTSLLEDVQSPKMMDKLSETKSSSKEPNDHIKNTDKEIKMNLVDEPINPSSGKFTDKEHPPQIKELVIEEPCKKTNIYVTESDIELNKAERNCMNTETNTIPTYNDAVDATMEEMFSENVEDSLGYLDSDVQSVEIETVFPQSTESVNKKSPPVIMDQANETIKSSEYEEVNIENNDSLLEMLEDPSSPSNTDLVENKSVSFEQTKDIEAPDNLPLKETVCVPSDASSEFVVYDEREPEIQTMSSATDGSGESSIMEHLETFSIKNASEEEPSRLAADSKVVILDDGPNFNVEPNITVEVTESKQKETKVEDWTPQVNVDNQISGTENSSDTTYDVEKLEAMSYKVSKVEESEGTTDHKSCFEKLVDVQNIHSKVNESEKNSNIDNKLDKLDEDLTVNPTADVLRVLSDQDEQKSKMENLIYVEENRDNPENISPKSIVDKLEDNFSVGEMGEDSKNIDYLRKSINVVETKPFVIDKIDKDATAKDQLESDLSLEPTIEDMKIMVRPDEDVNKFDEEIEAVSTITCGNNFSQKCINDKLDSGLFVDVEDKIVNPEHTKTKHLECTLSSYDNFVKEKSEDKFCKIFQAKDNKYFADTGKLISHVEDKLGTNVGKSESNTDAVVVIDESEGDKFAGCKLDNGESNSEKVKTVKVLGIEPLTVAQFEDTNLDDPVISSLGNEPPLELSEEKSEMGVVPEVINEVESAPSVDNKVEESENDKYIKTEMDGVNSGVEISPNIDDFQDTVDKLEEFKTKTNTNKNSFEVITSLEGIMDGPERNVVEAVDDQLESKMLEDSKIDCSVFTQDENKMKINLENDQPVDSTLEECANTEDFEALIDKLEDESSTQAGMPTDDFTSKVEDEPCAEKNGLGKSKNNVFPKELVDRKESKLSLDNRFEEKDHKGDINNTKLNKETELSIHDSEDIPLNKNYVGAIVDNPNGELLVNTKTEGSNNIVHPTEVLMTLEEPLIKARMGELQNKVDSNEALKELYDETFMITSLEDVQSTVDTEKLVNKEEEVIVKSKIENSNSMITENVDEKIQDESLSRTCEIEPSSLSDNTFNSSNNEFSEVLGVSLKDNLTVEDKLDVDNIAGEPDHNIKMTNFNNETESCVDLVIVKQNIDEESMLCTRGNDIHNEEDSAAASISASELLPPIKPSDSNIVVLEENVPSSSTIVNVDTSISGFINQVTENYSEDIINSSVEQFNKELPTEIPDIPLILKNTPEIKPTTKVLGDSATGSLSQKEVYSLTKTQADTCETFDNTQNNKDLLDVHNEESLINIEKEAKFETSEIKNTNSPKQHAEAHDNSEFETIQAVGSFLRDTDANNQINSNLQSIERNSNISTKCSEVKKESQQTMGVLKASELNEEVTCLATAIRINQCKDIDLECNKTKGSTIELVDEKEDTSGRKSEEENLKEIKEPITTEKQVKHPQLGESSSHFSLDPLKLNPKVVKTQESVNISNDYPIKNAEETKDKQKDLTKGLVSADSFPKSSKSITEITNIECKGIPNKQQPVPKKNILSGKTDWSFQSTSSAVNLNVQDKIKDVEVCVIKPVSKIISKHVEEEVKDSKETTSIKEKDLPVPIASEKSDNPLFQVAEMETKQNKTHTIEHTLSTDKNIAVDSDSSNTKKPRRKLKRSTPTQPSGKLDDNLSFKTESEKKSISPDTSSNANSSISSPQVSGPIIKVTPKTASAKEIPAPVRVSARQKQRQAAAAAALAAKEKAKLAKSVPESVSKKGSSLEKQLDKRGKKSVSPMKELQIKTSTIKSTDGGKQSPLIGQKSPKPAEVKTMLLTSPKKTTKELCQDKLEPITLKLSKEDNPVIVKSSSLSPKKIISSSLSPQNKTLSYTLKIGKDSTTIIPKDPTLSPKTRDSSPGSSNSKADLSGKVGYLIKDTGLTITPIAPAETQEQKLNKITLKLSKAGGHPEIKQEKSDTWKAIQKLGEIDIVPVEGKPSTDNSKRKESDHGSPEKKLKLGDLTVEPSTSSGLSKLQGLLTQAPLNQSDDSDDIQFVGFGPTTEVQQISYDVSSVKHEREPQLHKKRGRPRKITSPSEMVHSVAQPLPSSLSTKNILVSSLQHQTLGQHLQQMQQPMQLMHSQEEECSSTMFPVPLFDLSEDTFIDPTPPTVFPDQVQPETILRSARGRPIGRSRRPRGSSLLRGTERGGPRGRPRGSRGIKRMLEEMESLSYPDMDEPITLDNIDSEIGPRLSEHSGSQITEKTMALLRKSIEGKKESMERKARKSDLSEDRNKDSELDAKVKEMKEKIEAAYQAELKSPGKRTPEKEGKKKTPEKVEIKELIKKGPPELIPININLERNSSTEKKSVTNTVSEGLECPNRKSNDEQSDSSSVVGKHSLKRKLSLEKSKESHGISKVSKRKSTEEKLDTRESIESMQSDSLNYEGNSSNFSQTTDDDKNVSIKELDFEEMDVDQPVSPGEPVQENETKAEPEPPPKPVRPRPKSKAEIKRIKREKDRIRREAKKLAALEALKAPPPNPFEEDTRMSASDPNGDGIDDLGNGIKKNRMEVGDPEGKEFTVEHIAEYQWPLQGGELYMIQEQISTYLGVKSFKRKYPDIKRRPVEMEERTFLCDSGLVSESMCDLGLTAVSSSEVLDIMFQDFQDQYEELRKHMREKQARELINKQKERKKFEQSLSKSDLKEQAIQSSMSWNQSLNKNRNENRRCHLDLQTWTVQYPRSRGAQMTRPTTRLGSYPVALIPGQYTDYYKRYTPQELRYWPLNTVLYGPLQPNERHSTGGSDGSQSESEDSSSSDDSSDSSSEGEGTCEEEERDCKACGGGKRGSEAMVQCSQCGHNSKSTKAPRIALFPINAPPGTTATVWA